MATNQAWDWSDGRQPAELNSHGFNSHGFTGVVQSLPVEQSIHELSVIDGMVHEHHKKLDNFLLDLRYPGHYEIQFSFTHPQDFEGLLYAPNIELVLVQRNHDHTSTEWLGDLDAAFAAHSLAVPVAFSGRGIYRINGADYHPDKGQLYLAVEAFDTNGCWIPYRISLTDNLRG